MPPAASADASSPSSLPTLLLCALIGTVWGFSNPFVRRGAIAVEEKKKRRPPSQGGLLQDLHLLLTTPAFLAPQLLNQGGSVAFNALLASGKAPLSVANPAVNAVTLAANALADVLLGERYRLSLLVPGVALVTAGLVLCST